jgi:glycosyltransferase involved in cell wall biosynthesis
MASIVIRTLNEYKHLQELFGAIANQHTPDFHVEVVLVDSGSTDGTLDIATHFGCRITTIDQSEFTFGRSLNRGCDFAQGDYLVFLSGHCIPAKADWLAELLGPLRQGMADYVYGRQIGRDTTKFSEDMLFRKYYPAESRIPQQGYFCNNANAAVTRLAWGRYQFNEELTGLEDMYLAKQIVADGGHVAYVAEAPVHHIHDETWTQVCIRYEREALALRNILPEVHFSLVDFARCYLSGVATDIAAARREGVLKGNASDIAPLSVSWTHG